MISSVLKTYKDPRHLWKNLVWRIGARTSCISVVFIVGAPRSGTTLLQRLVSIHSRACSIQGETGIFTYQDIFDLRRKHFGLPVSEIQKLYNSAGDIVDFFEKGVGLSYSPDEKKIFVEKTPQHVFHLRFILNHFPKCKIIHIVRDGRDCYCSSKAVPGIPQNKSVRSFAKYWKKCVRAGCHYEALRDRLLTVKYEDLVTDSETVLSVIMGFLNLPMEHRQLDPGLVGDDRRAKLPWFKKLGSPISSSSVERWKKELSLNEVREFEKIAYKELLHFSYEIFTAVQHC